MLTFHSFSLQLKGLPWITAALRPKPRRLRTRPEFGPLMRTSLMAHPDRILLQPNHLMLSLLGSKPPHVAEHIAEHVITWPVRKLAQSVCELQPCPQDQSITNHHRCNDCYLIQPSLCRINSHGLGFSSKTWFNYCYHTFLFHTHI
jgi:hypothetical protein